MELQEKVALITGAGSGIGKAAAVRFAQEGAIVGILSHTEQEVGQTVDEIRAAGGKAMALVADVADAANRPSVGWCRNSAASISSSPTPASMASGLPSMS
jgi:NAD(P)-dependent dehydrogenase (short-subunit alcohol dehydrogenase family)